MRNAKHRFSSRPPARRRASTVAAGALAAALLLTPVGAGAAAAAVLGPDADRHDADRHGAIGPTPAPRAAVGDVVPAAPADAIDPVVVLHEPFDDLRGTEPVRLDDYVGVAGARYTADPEWLSGPACNGFVLRAQSGRVPGCSERDRLRALTRALGRLDGSDPERDAGVSAYTSGDPGAGHVQFSTVEPVSLGATVANRFLSFGVDAVASACYAAHPLLAFSIVDGGVETPASAAPIDPCDSPGSADLGDGVRGGRFASPGGVLFSGETVGIVLRNAEGSGTGNDGAFDDIRLFDSTPVLGIEAPPAGVVAGDEVPLTLTVRNTSELGAKPGWALAADLPPGLRLVGDAPVTSTCAEPLVEVDGDDRFRLGAALASGEASCSVTATIVADEGSYPVAGDWFVGTGLDVADDLGPRLEVAPATPAVALASRAELTDLDGDDAADPGEQVRFAHTATNTGNVPLGDLAVGGTESGLVACDVTDLAPGAATSCRSEPRLVTQADLDAGRLRDLARASATARGGSAVESGIAAAEVPLGERVASLVAEADAVLRDASGAVVEGGAEVGHDLHVGVTLANPGTLTLAGLGAVSDRAGELTCRASSLAPGESTRCTGPASPVTQADVDAPAITDRVVAGAVAAGGAPVAAESTVEVATAVERVALDGRPEALVDGEPAGPLSVGDDLTWQVDVVATGTATVLDPAVTLSDGSALACPAGVRLAPGEHVTCRAEAPRTITQADVDAQRVAESFTTTGRSVRGTTTSHESALRLATEAAAPALATAVTPTPHTEEARPGLAVGDRLGLVATVTNTGNVTLSGVEVVAAGLGDDVPCRVEPLAPGRSRDCTPDATRLVDQGDVDRGGVTLTATSSGTAPDEAVVESAPASVEVAAVAAAPHLALTGVVTVERASDGGVADAAGTGGEAADEAGGPARPGDRLRGEFRVVNDGNLTLDAVTVVLGDADGARSRSGLACDVVALAPGAAATCSGTVLDEVPASSAVDGVVATTARASALAPRGEPEVTSDALQIVTEVEAAAEVEPGPGPGPEPGEEPDSARPATPAALAFTGAPVVGILIVAAITLLAGGLAFFIARRGGH